MKSLNKLFSFGLVALALTFGAYASNDGEQQPVQETPYAKIKTFTLDTFEAAQNFSQTLYGKAPVKVRQAVDGTFNLSKTIWESSPVQKFWDAVEPYGTRLVSLGLGETETFVNWFTPAIFEKAYGFFDTAEMGCANLKRRFSKVEKKEEKKD